MRTLAFIFFLILSSAAFCVDSKPPKLLFTMECQGCHLANGNGGVTSVPPLNNHVAKFLTVEGGREYLAQVPGVARSPLSDKEITRILNWLLFEFGPQNIANKYPPYTVSEVSHLRKTPLTEVTKTRGQLILKINSSHTP